MINTKKMKNLDDYFHGAMNDANEEYLGFDGDMDDDFSFMDDDDEFQNASGGGRGGSPTSQPYIVNVANTDSNTDIANVTILGAYTALSASSPAFGNTAGVELGMGISGITYTEFLYQSMNKPFQIGMTYISDTVQSSNVLETFTLIKKDVNGNQLNKVLTPTIDPYQQQNDKIAFSFDYTIDGFTSIVISQVLRATASANNVLKCYLYPAETISVTRGLAGRKAVRGYGNPKVVRGNKVVLGRSARRELGS